MNPYFSRRTSIGFGCALLIAAAAPPAGAYINGGTKKNDLSEVRSRVTFQGYRAAIGSFTEKVDFKNEEKFAPWVKQLVGKALAELPPQERELMTPEQRDELAAFAQRELAPALEQQSNKPVVQQIGPWSCKVGGCDVYSWWETNYGKKGLQIHARKFAGYAPYVALKHKPPAE